MYNLLGIYYVSDICYMFCMQCITLNMTIVLSVGYVTFLTVYNRIFELNEVLCLIPVLTGDRVRSVYHILYGFREYMHNKPITHLHF